MNTPDGKIVRFPAGLGTTVDPVCESCGSPKQTDFLCRNCAFRLVDVALSSGSEGLSELLAVDAGRADSAPLAIQLRYGHYEVCLTGQGEPWELGRGAMGITYKATDVDLRCPVALKIINTRRLGSAAARARFVQEARTAARLRHTNIASVFHLGSGDENCFYAMEYIEGETLESLVQREGALPWRFALDVTAQSARGLQVAHAQNFIHRDIKPTNIMLVATGLSTTEHALVKLIDFGLVKAVEDDAPGDLICEKYFAGTPLYASPEQIESGEVDPRSDIFSLGCCLLYMLTGSAPQPSADGTNETLLGHPASCITTRLPSDTPAPVLALLRSMVSRDPTLRPQTAYELCSQITMCQVGTDTPLEIVPEEALPASQHKRHRRLALLGAGVLGLVVTSALAANSFFLHRNYNNLAPVPSQPPISAEAKALYTQGFEYYRKYTREDMQRAIDCMLKAIEKSPAYSEAHAILANFYLENVMRFTAPGSQIDLAITSAQRGIATDPNNAMAYQVLGAIRSYQRKPWEALTELQHALELDPKSAHAMCDFSLLWSIVGQPQWALPWALAAAQLEPSKIGGWHAAAEASIDLCEDDQAAEFYRRCTELQPVWTSAYCGLIHLYLLRGEFDAARRECAKVESIQSGLLFPLTLKGQISLFGGDYDDAEKTYRQLIVMKRDGMVGYYGGISYLSALGFLRLRVGDIAEGQAFLAEAANLHAANSEGPNEIYDLAAIRAIENRKEAALLLLKQAINSGWKDYRSIELDPRFNNLRGVAEFHSICEDLRQHVAELRAEAKVLCGKPIVLSDYPVRPPAKNGVN